MANILREISRRSFTQWLALLTVLFLSGANAHAHSMYQSSVMLDFQGSTVAVELQLPPSRLGEAFGAALTPSNLDAQQQRLSQYILARLHAFASGGQAFTVQMTAPLRFTTVDGAPYLIAHLQLTPPRGASTRSFVLEDHVILDSLPTNVALVSIRSDWSSSTFANDPQLLGVLNGSEETVDVDRNAGSWWKGFGAVFHLGVRHIAEGTDHLLFLLTLLLPAPLLAIAGRWNGPTTARHGLLRVFRIVTAFTLGHSATLALATFGLVHVPGRPIEVLIAISILVSAVHALRPLFPGREGYIAAGFGLIHGLAFASTLAELGLTRWERVASILSFNLGIESMQLLVVAAILPSFMLLSRTSLYRYLRVSGGIFAGVAAASWAVQRTFEIANPLDRWIDALAQNGLWCAVALLVLSAVAWAGWRLPPKLIAKGQSQLTSDAATL